MGKKREAVAVPWSERKLSRVWKSFLISAVAVLAVATVFFWYRGGWKNIDQLTNSYAVFAVFLALIAASFFVQYRYGVPERRKREIRRRTLILFVFAAGVAAFAAALLRLQNPDISLRSTISTIVRTPAVLGSVLGLFLGGALLWFALLPRGDQRRAKSVFLMVLAGFLTFGGPTYLIYALNPLLIPYSFLLLLGLASFVVGVILFLRLLGKESKTEFPR